MQRAVISIRNKFKRQKSPSLPFSVTQGAKNCEICVSQEAELIARDGKGKRMDRVERAAYTESSSVHSLARSPARSMMLSLHNLRGTVTGSRERMAVPAS